MTKDQTETLLDLLETVANELDSIAQTLAELEHRQAVGR